MLRGSWDEGQAVLGTVAALPADDLIKDLLLLQLRPPYTLPSW